MGPFPMLIAAAFTTASAAPPAGPAAQTASLAFVADTPYVGAAYGIEALDGHRRVYGERLAADVAAGHRTVAYVCPAASGGDTAQLGFDFEPGRRYELVCRAGQPAVIRAADC